MRAAKVIVVNRGRVVNVQTTPDNGAAEREAAAADMLGEIARLSKHATVGADTGYDTRGFVRASVKSALSGTQHINRIGRSAIDARTTRHGGYEISQGKRMRIEHCFDWAKTIRPMRQVMVRELRKVITPSC